MAVDLNGVYKEDNFQCTIWGQQITVRYTINNSLAASLDFNLHGSAHNFSIDNWSRKGYTSFGKRFFNYAPRDVRTFGTMAEGDLGEITLDQSTQQKVSVIEQGLKDIMHCVSLIATKYKRAMIDYAIWYRETYPREDTYDLFITRRACHLIVHTNIHAPDLVYDIVRFV